MFQRQFLSFPESVQDFLREREVSNIDTHIKDVDVNSTCTYDDTTVLMMVCMYSHAYDPLRYSYYIPCAVEKLKWLLSKGADPNIQNDDGWTALMWASNFSKPVKIFRGKCFMEKIEKYKIHPIKQGLNRYISLMIVAYLDKNDIFFKSSEKIVKILLEGGANPNIQNNGGYTALSYAILYSSRDSSKKTVEILLKGGANPNIQDGGRMTAVMRMTHDPSMKQLLLKYL